MKHTSSGWWPESEKREARGERRANTSSPLAPELIAPLVLGLLCIFLFFHRLADRGLNSSHESRAAQHAQMMLTDGSWLLPRLFNQRVDLQKPPLYYWLVAGLSGLRGVPVDAWSVRFPAALAALLCVLVLYQSLANRGRRLAGFCAAVVLATCIHFTWLARVGRIDMPLTLMVTITLTAASGGLYSRRRTWLLAYTAIGIGILLKGPIALVLPTAVMILARISPGRAKVAPPGLFCGVPLIVLIAAPWFLLANWHTDGQVWRDFFLYHNFERGLGGAEELAGGPFWYYVPRLCVDLFPWSMLLPLAVWWYAKDDSRHVDSDARFGLIWFLGIVGFFSLMHFKRADYLLPAYPGFALWLGCIAERRLQAGQRWLAWGGGLLALACLIGWVICLERVLPREQESRGYERFAHEIRRLTHRPVIFFRTEAHEVVFHVGRPLDTILEWENLDFWATRPHPIYMVMPPDCAASWRQHLQKGRLEEVLRSTALGCNRRERPLVLMRSTGWKASAADSTLGVCRNLP